MMSVGKVKPFGDKIRSGWVGLFWLSDDYMKIIATSGMREFSHSDVVTKATLDPVGFHMDSLGDKGPRGRVVLNKGKVCVCLGENAPNIIIGKVVDVFELRNYKDSLEVIRDPNWDSGELVDESERFY
jgi:hypothetical protein